MSGYSKIGGKDMAELQWAPAELRAAAAASSKAKERLTYLFDDGKYNELDAMAAGRELCGVICAYGKVNGSPCYAFSQDVSRNLGALDFAQAKKIARTLRLAGETGVPVVGIYDSCGADLNDGHKALIAYGELLLKMSNLSGVVPQIAVIAGVCSGTSALLAESADITVIAEGAELYCTPGTEGSAGYAAKNGTAAIKAADDKAAVEAAKALLEKLPLNNLSPAPAFDFAAPSGISTVDMTLDGDSATELYADFGKASYTALASVEGTPVGVVSTDKAAKLTSDDCSKIARFVRFCDSFSVPVITFVDTEGFEDDGAGAVKNMAKVAHAYAEATTAKISVVTGKAYGAAFIALAGRGANADISFAVNTARITALAPDTAAEFFYHDELKGAADAASKRKELAERYVTEEGAPFAAAASGCADEVISTAELRSALAAALEQLSSKRVSRRPKKHSNIQL